MQANSTSEQTYAKPATASEEYVLDSDFRIERVRLGMGEADCCWDGHWMDLCLSLASLHLVHA